MHCQEFPGDSDVAVMEQLECRRLCSVSVASLPVALAGDHITAVIAATRQSKAVKTVVVIASGSRFEGQLVVTKSSRPLTIDGLGAGTVAPGSSRFAQMAITGRGIDGRLSGTMSIDGLGLAGILGAFNMTGRIKGQRMVLNLADNGGGVAWVDARISQNGRVISGKFTSRVNGDMTQGQLRLVFTRPSAIQTILGFRPFNTGMVIGFRSLV